MVANVHCLCKNVHFSYPDCILLGSLKSFLMRSKVTEQSAMLILVMHVTSFRKDEINVI